MPQGMDKLRKEKDKQRRKRGRDIGKNQSPDFVYCTESRRMFFFYAKGVKSYRREKRIGKKKKQFIKGTN